MPSTSANGAVTRLSGAASNAVDLLRAALERAHEEQAPFTADGLAPFWPEMPIQDLVEAVLNRVRPVSHLAAAMRSSEVTSELTRSAQRFWDRFRAEPFRGTVKHPGGDHQRVVELVAGEYVDDFCELITMTWQNLHEQASKRYWATRTEADGRVTVGTSKAGRRQRSTPEVLMVEDAEHAWEQAQKATRDVGAVTRYGVHRRLARCARLQAGWTQQQAQYATRVTFGWGGWEQSSTGPDETGVPAQPRGFAWGWAQISAVFGLDPQVSDGPHVSSIRCPVTAQVRHDWVTEMEERAAARARE